jgi:membrane protease YdiL (CAAX protease family)
MKNLIKRFELPSFFLLTYLLSWLTVPFMQGGLTSWGVAIAARIVIGVTLGIQGVREYHKRVTNWRAGWWYLIAPLIVIGYEGIAFVINLIAGAKLIQLPHLSAGTLLMLVLFGGQWEELGWTGYALPRLRERFANLSNGSLIAVLVLGVFRMIWHLPLFLYAKMDWFDIFIFTFAFQIIIAWVYDRSGSVLVVMTLHFMSNILGAAMPVVFFGADQILFRALFMAVASLLAVMLAASPQFKKREEKLAVI